MAQVFQTAPLSINLRLVGQRPFVSVIGEADSSNITRIVRILDQLSGEYEECVSLDLERLVNMDTVALRGLAMSATTLCEHRKRLYLKSASRSVTGLLERLGLSGIFCTHHECEGKCHPQTCGTASEVWSMDIFTCPCKVTECHQTRERVKRVAEASGFSKSECADIALAVGEAASNAIKYGEPADGIGEFTVSCLGTREKFCVCISDNGPGFSLDDVPTFEQAIYMEHGRGIHCMKAVMDEVSFNFDGGTTVRMVKIAQR